MDWRTKRPDAHFSDKVENMKGIIVPRPNRQTTSLGFAVFCYDLYRDLEMTVDIFLGNIKKTSARLRFSRFLGLNFTKSDIA